MDFKFDETTGDLDLSEGLQFISGAEELQQRIEIGFTINLNEFFTHVNYGLPWLRDENNNIFPDIQYFLGEDIQTSISYIVKQLDRYIENISQVTSVTSSYDFDSRSRTLTYSPVITGQEGEELVFPPYTFNIQ